MWQTDTAGRQRPRYAERRAGKKCDDMPFVPADSNSNCWCLWMDVSSACRIRFCRLALQLVIVCFEIGWLERPWPSCGVVKVTSCWPTCCWMTSRRLRRPRTETRASWWWRRQCMISSSPRNEAVSTFESLPCWWWRWMLLYSNVIAPKGYFLADVIRRTPRAGSGVVRIDPLRFLAGCRTRRLNSVWPLLA